LSVKSYRFVLVADLAYEAQMKIRDIRNKEGVRKWMYSDRVIDKDEHIRWIERLKTDDRQKTFAIVEDISRMPIGLASVNNIDATHKKASWAFYIDEFLRGLGGGLARSWNLICLTTVLTI
jgi:UDP-4-amino-4,6-dideoxy-N-acetyl-beta-L-altrosamine N-acetyltransferase